MKQKLERLAGMRQVSRAVNSSYDHSVNSTANNCDHTGMRKFEEEELREKAHRH